MALAGVGLSAVMALSACGNAAPPAAGGGEPAPASSSSAYTDPGQLWPDAARTVVTTPRGQRPQLAPPDEHALHDAGVWAEQEGTTVEQALLESQDQQVLSELFDRARPLLGARWTRGAMGVDGDPPHTAFTGDVPPDLVALAEQVHVPVELRGGALLSEQEAETARRAGYDAFAALAPEGVGYSGGLDDPTATFSFSGFAAEEWQPGDDVRAAVVAAAVRALGRDAPFAVELHPDDRDPQSTEPAVWYLPAGFVADPSATSIEVVVDSRGCASGVGPADRMAPPQVEVTDTQVRIAVSTYILKGPQTCPGHPTAPLVVDLGEPLGDRELVDVNGSADDAHAPPGGGLVVPVCRMRTTTARRGLQRQRVRQRLQQ